jgi:hypothetical protein
LAAAVISDTMGVVDAGWLGSLDGVVAMRRWRTTIIMSMLLGTTSAPCVAQAAAPERLAGASSIGAWAGLARHSPGGPFGNSTGNDLAIVAVRLTRTLHQSSHWSLDYSADLVPAAWVSRAPNADTLVVLPCDGNETGCVFRTSFPGRRRIHGFGAAPLGLQLRLLPNGRVQPFFTASGGGLWFSEPVPSERAGRFNFTAEVGAGALCHVTRTLGVIAGYKLQHISNGGTRPYNPGIDNNLFYLGLARPVGVAGRSPNR